MRDDETSRGFEPRQWTADRAPEPRESDDRCDDDGRDGESESLHRLPCAEDLRLTGWV
jgi:hypothetical protein